MAVVAVYSVKGGVGKTTLAVNLAWAAATLSARPALLWDLDAKGAATWLLGGGGAGRDRAQAAFTREVELARLVRPTAIDRLELIGADPSLRSLDLLFRDLDKKKRLARLLETLAGRYDHILLDCPPGLTETSRQVMRAADLVLVPVTPSPLSGRALAEVAAHLGRQGRAVPLLPVHSMVDRRRSLHAAALAAGPDWPAMPMASIVEAMAVRRQPLGAYAPRSPAARAVADLWQAVERRLAAAR